MGSSNRPDERAGAADLDALWRVLDAFEAEVWDEVHLVTGDCEIHLRRDGSGVAATPRAAAATAAPAPPATATPAPATPAPPTASTPEPTPPLPGQPAPADTDGLIEITAPSVGIFWAQPEPGAPPFVAPGDAVEPNTTVCIIEVMKLMNHVKAADRGRIARVLVGNGQAVERGQALFLVESTSP